MLPAIAFCLTLLGPQTAVPVLPPKTTSTDPATPSNPLRANPDASGKYHVGDGVTQPKIIYQVEPEFSEAARKKKISAHVLVGLTVDADGNCVNVNVLRSAAEQADRSIATPRCPSIRRRSKP